MAGGNRKILGSRLLERRGITAILPESCDMLYDGYDSEDQSKGCGNWDIFNILLMNLATCQVTPNSQRSKSITCIQQSYLIAITTLCNFASQKMLAYVIWNEDLICSLNLAICIGNTFLHRGVLDFFWNWNILLTCKVIIFIAKSVTHSCHYRLKNPDVAPQQNYEYLICLIAGGKDYGSHHNTHQREKSN